MEIEKYVPKHILEIAPYSLDADFSKDSEELTRMSLNENLFIDLKEITNLLEESSRKVDPRFYPVPHGGTAVKAISNFFSINESKIFVGNGLDDVLDRISRVFISEGTKVGIIEPTFSIYSYYVELCKGEEIPILLKENFELDVDNILNSCIDDAKILFLCSPNSPTGNQFKEEDVREILSNFKDIVIVDETYVDFGRYSVFDWLDEFENLIVLRSFSKSFGLAGVRIGYLLADEDVVDVMKKSVHPFNVNSVSQQVVAIVFRRYDYFKSKIEYLKKERTRLIETLRDISGVTAYSSDANFVLFRVDKETVESSKVQSKLKEKGILIKDRGNLPLLKNCLRMTVGTRDMNDKFIYSLKNILENRI